MPKTQSQISSAAATPLFSGSAMEDNVQIDHWLRRDDAAPEVKLKLAKFLADTGEEFKFPPRFVVYWWSKFLCDLIGLLLFGPCFLAAHRTLISSSETNPYEFSLTHPPYAARHRLLVQASSVLCWDVPLTSRQHGMIFDAENGFYESVLEDGFLTWANLFSTAQVKSAVDGLVSILSVYNVMYQRPSGHEVSESVGKIIKTAPPLTATVGRDGLPDLRGFSVANILYAGWVFWLGRHELDNPASLNFQQINKLCSLALTQQEAIDLFIA